MEDPTPKSMYRPLHVELGIPSALIQAGFHDADRPSILSHSTNQMLVSQHELHHDVALTETNFGFVQLIVRRLYDNPNAASVRQSAGDWLLHLFKHSRVSHEALATYLTIKQQPYQVCQSLVSELPEEYKEYYRKLALVIDELFPSTFLQFMIGKILIEICFSSRFIVKMLDWKPGMTPILEDEDSPDQRLEILIPLWKSRLPDMRAWLQEHCPKQDYYQGIGFAFNVLSEQDWVSIPSRITSKIDDWLDIVCRAWMYPVASAVLPCSDRTEWYDQRKRFLDHMNQFCSDPVQMGGSAADFLKDNDQKRAARRGFRASRATISNPLANLLNREKIDERALIDFVVNSRRQGGHEVERPGSVETKVLDLISPEPGASKQARGDWGVFGFDRERCLSGHLADHAAVLNLLRLGTLFGASTGYSFIGCLRIIVGLWAADSGSVDTTLMNEVLGACSCGAGRINLTNAVWYMGGNFLQFYRSLVARGGVEVFSINPFEHNEELPPIPFEKIRGFVENTSFEETAKLFSRVAHGPTWLLFRCPSVPGWFVRIVPVGMEAFVPVGEDIVAQRVRLVPKSEWEPAWQWLSGIQMPVLSMWARF